MIRITVSLPDELAERVRRAAGGEGRVSSYVATALADYQERETLAEILAAWGSETSISAETAREAAAALDAVGIQPRSTRSRRSAR